MEGLADGGLVVGGAKAAHGLVVKAPSLGNSILKKERRTKENSGLSATGIH